MLIGYVALGAFVLVFVVFPAALLLADRYSDRVHAALDARWKRLRRELAARWLAEDGLTVTPLRREEGLRPRVDGDEMVRIIRGIGHV